MPGYCMPSGNAHCVLHMPPPLPAGTSMKKHRQGSDQTGAWGRGVWEHRQCAPLRNPTVSVGIDLDHLYSAFD